VIALQAVPGSFRDPSGRVYQNEERIYRTVARQFALEFEFVQSTGLLQKFSDEGKVLPAMQVDTALQGTTGYEVAYLLEVPRLPFVSFPYEWPFSALKTAALLHLEIHLAALQKDVTLSDASAYNVQFQGARPVFIDHLSFRRYRPGEMWIGHSQFCDQFLNPLLLRALLGISHNAWYRGALEGISTQDLSYLLSWRHYLQWNVLTHVGLHAFFHREAQANKVDLKKGTLSQTQLTRQSFCQMLENLHGWIQTLKPLDSGKTVWEDYVETKSYGSQEVIRKKSFVADFASHTMPKILWDLGCNTGEFSQVALEAGADYVIGMDFDQGALEAGFARAEHKNLNLTMLCMDASNPSPSQGWRGEERASLQARGSADAILALAFVHHLAIARNIPFDQLLDWLLSLAPQGVIEFIPKSDPMVQRLLSLREDIFPDYTEAFFLNHIGLQCEIVKTESISSTGRLLVWFKKT